MIQAAEGNVARVSANTIIIPGHGPVGDKAGLTDFRNMLVAVRDRVAQLKKQGRTLAEVVAAKPTADYDETWGKWVIDGSTFTSLVYAGV
jgi:hypothetical protein